MRKRSWISCAAAMALSFSAGSQALGQERMFFQGPYGAGGTYNVYEIRGVGNRTFGNHIGRNPITSGAGNSYATGDALTQTGAWVIEGNHTEPFSGTAKVAHLAAFSGALAADENQFVTNTFAFLGQSAWIGLTDDEFFGGGESRPGPLPGEAGAQQNACGDCIEAKNSGFAGGPDAAVDDGAGWQWTNKEPYDYQNWNGLGEPNDYTPTNPPLAGEGEDATELLTNGTWNDNGDGEVGESAPTRAYIYEYETLSATALNVPLLPQVNLAVFDPTPAPSVPNTLGKVRVREVHSTQTVSGNAGALNLLYGNQPQDFEVNYLADTININAVAGAGGSFFPGDSNFGLNTIPSLTGTDINNFALSARGFVRIEEAGQYTFNVATDDSGEVWIYGKTFESVSNGTISPYGSIMFAGDRGHGNTLGVVTLEPGDYEFEYVMNENGGGASAEFSAAFGAQSSFDPRTFKLVGGDPNPTNYPAQNRPVRVNGSLAIKEVRDSGDIDLNNLAQARAILDSPGVGDIVVEGTATGVNFADPDAPGGGQFGNNQNFLSDTAGDNDDFALRASGTITVDTAGDYTFAFDSDDGAALTVGGASFTRQFGPNATTVASGETLSHDANTGSSLSGASTFLTAGSHTIEFVFWERGGGGFAELMVATGVQTAFNAAVFNILDTTASVPALTVPGALQFGDGTFEPEPDQEGDTNGDGKVDIVDLNNVRNNFGGTGLGDTNDDGQVTIADLNNVRNNFGAGPGANAVPEPSSMVLVGLGLVGLLAARRFRKN